MRVLKFDRWQTDALRRLGFEIAVDNETAAITGEMTTIDVIRSDADRFWLNTKLPNGVQIDVPADTRKLLQMAGALVDEKDGEVAS